MLATLLTARRFLPLFATQFLGAMNDNLFKNAMAVLLLWRAGSAGPALVAAAGGIFILPYALFSGLAGELADRSEMARLIRLIKLYEAALMCLGVVGFQTANAWLLMAVLFGLGIHSTFFGPLKYAILPVHLAPGELVAGNGLVEAGTFLAILLGTILGGGLILQPGGAWIVPLGAIGVGLAGYATARLIPSAPAAAPGLALDWNLWRGTMDILRRARANRSVWQAILAISWFWTVGATVLSQFPVIAKDGLGASSAVVTLFLATFSIGIGVGSMLEARLLKGVLSLRHVPWATLGISLFAWDFVRACDGARFADISAIIAAPAGWRILADLFGLAACGGIYSVPLYTTLQERSAPAIRSRVIASNNVMNALFMVAGALAATLLAGRGVGAGTILELTALANLLALGWLLLTLPADARPAQLRRR
jgi:acyl-[acyl-carrier-protein]-phospholipid O-acyltransferase / long-chain-fatty-acid--[acyl-carrier-protein] ligase